MFSELLLATLGAQAAQKFFTKVESNPTTIKMLFFNGKLNF